MQNFLNKTKTFLSLFAGLLLMISVEAAVAQGNSQGNGNGNSNAGGNGNGNGQNKNIGVGNASDGISGRISTNKGVIYTGDPLEISVSFPRGAELITDGEVDAFVVVFAPTVDDSDDSDSSDTDSSDAANDESTDDSATGNGTADALSDPIVVPVSDAASEEETKLFEVSEVDLSALSAGTYQLGLILTNPSGDPLTIGDWYTGLLGLIDVVGLTITDEAVDFDADMDGVVDDDLDGDGLSDEDDDDSDDDDDDSDSDSSTDTASGT